MALSYYDPLSDLYLGVPCPRDPWGVCQWSPMARWGESLVPKVLTVPLVKYSSREIVSDKDKFQVTLDLGDFKSNEINVKLVDRSLMICAEHEEKPDEYGHIYRHIKRSYFLPRNVDCDKLNATLSDNGTLVVCAQKKAIEAGSERKIEVKQLAPESKSQSQVSQKTEKETGKAKGTNIPVTHETGKKA